MTCREYKSGLLALKSISQEEGLTTGEIQAKLSALLLSGCETPLDLEKRARHFDNELELIIYTKRAEDQLSAALGVIQDAIEYFEKNGQYVPQQGTDALRLPRSGREL